ncbi:MAG: cell division protein FtsQ/DivIB [Pseudomonadota bacterium]
MLPVKPQKSQPKGPGLSKTRYRWQRGWGQRLRRVGLIYLPLILLAGAIWIVAREESWRLQLSGYVMTEIDTLLETQELAIRRVEITGAQPGMRAEISARLSTLVGRSSMKLDLEALRGELEAIGRVRRADVALGPGGILRVALSERVPAALWRDAEGELWVLDRDGVQIAPAGPRANHPHLLVVLGRDAPDHVAEGLRIAAAAPSLMPRLRAMIRVGERRWDLALDRDQRILLPETRPEMALARVMALAKGEDELLKRDVAIVDLRIPERPVLRLPGRAVETRRLQMEAAKGVGEET